MVGERETTKNDSFSKKSDIEEINIEMDRQVNDGEEIEKPEETTVPFIYRNQS